MKNAMCMRINVSSDHLVSRRHVFCIRMRERHTHIHVTFVYCDYVIVKALTHIYSYIMIIYMWLPMLLLLFLYGHLHVFNSRIQCLFFSRSLVNIVLYMRQVA